jgi:hypothetical protein
VFCNLLGSSSLIHPWSDGPTEVICSAQIFGPTLFGSVYSATVSTFPQCVFVVCATAIAVAGLATLPIRLLPPPDTDVLEENFSSDTTS